MNNKLAKCQILRTNGDVCNHYFKGEKATLEECQKLVDGNIEVLRLDSQKMMIVNEDGLFRQLDRNEPAINYLYDYGITQVPIVGDVFIIDVKFFD